MAEEENEDFDFGEDMLHELVEGWDPNPVCDPSTAASGNIITVSTTLIYNLVHHNDICIPCSL